MAVDQRSVALTRDRPRGGFRRRAKRLLAEPTIHFLVIALLLFAVHRLVAGDPRRIVVSPALSADIERQLRDHIGRPPTAAELELALRDWKRDEALYREALRLGLDRDDATIRRVLADKVRARLALEVPQRAPSDAELQRFLEAHRSRYEIPARYDYEFVTFPRTERNAEEQRSAFERALKEGAAPPSLGRPIAGGHLALDELRQTLEASLAERIVGLPVGRWERFENADGLLLVRLKSISGGLPAMETVRGALIADYVRTAREEAVQRAAQAIADRYRFEERP